MEHTVSVRIIDILTLSTDTQHATAFIPYINVIYKTWLKAIEGKWNELKWI